MMRRDPNAGRKRARRLYPTLGQCQECGAEATDRHHINGDTFDNRPENIAFLCRRCHMAADGRLEAFLDLARQSPTQPPKPCANCGRDYKPLRHGRCEACAAYLARTGVERPPNCRERSWALDEAAALIAGGMTQRDVAKAMGVTHTTIWKALKRAGLPTAPARDEGPKPCEACGVPYKPRRRGLCARCYDRARRAATRTELGVRGA